MSTRSDDELIAAVLNDPKFSAYRQFFGDEEVRQQAREVLKELAAGGSDFSWEH